MSTVRLVVGAALCAVLCAPLLIVAAFCTPARQERMGLALRDLVKAFVE